MLLFRSEEHVDRWTARHGRGTTITMDQQWKLAKAWHRGDRRDPSWRRHTVDEAETLFASLGLTGEFWRLR